MLVQVRHRPASVVAIVGSFAMALLLSRIIPIGHTPAHNQAVGVPSGPTQPPEEVVGVVSEESADMSDSERRMRATWEQGDEVSLVNAFQWWALCRAGMGVRMHQDLLKAEGDPTAPESRQVRANFGGIQTKWWFRACLAVSPLIAEEQEPSS